MKIMDRQGKVVATFPAGHYACFESKTGYLHVYQIGDVGVQVSHSTSKDLPGYRTKIVSRLILDGESPILESDFAFYIKEADKK